ncbi:MAG: PEP-CTERM sorting domain-containing protein [Planctomycetia bacterium]|nr:PEP-CTERM sorting domain-containing protein [Planctomycetia bacterium]
MDGATIQPAKLGCRWCVLILTLLALVLGWPRPGSATTLIFDDENGNYLSQFQDFDGQFGIYGNRVAATPQDGYAYLIGTEGATPNVSAAYTTGNVTSGWETGIGDLLHAAIHFTGGPPLFELTLTADPGFVVQLHSLDLAGYHGDREIEEFQVLDGNDAPLFATTSPVTIPGDPGEHMSLIFGTPLSAAVLKIRIDEGGNATNIGIDNVLFSQEIESSPEPSTGMLAVAGLVGAAVLALRRRK